MSENELALHRKLAAETFNQTWDLMDKADRTPYETVKMIHLAHASVHHWSFVGEAVNMARGEWQVSRVYCVAGLAESALFHARRSLEICENAGIGGFDLAFGQEAMARALALAGKPEEARRHAALGREAAGGIEKAEDRAYFLAELGNIGV